MTYIGMLHRKQFEILSQILIEKIHFRELTPGIQVQLPARLTQKNHLFQVVFDYLRESGVIPVLFTQSLSNARPSGSTNPGCARKYILHGDDQSYG